MPITHACRLFVIYLFKSHSVRHQHLYRSDLLQKTGVPFLAFGAGSKGNRWRSIRNIVWVIVAVAPTIWPSADFLANGDLIAAIRSLPIFGRS
jgi:hypothetical protein